MQVLLYHNLKYVYLLFWLAHSCVGHYYRINKFKAAGSPSGADTRSVGDMQGYSISIDGLSRDLGLSDSFRIEDRQIFG